MWIKIRVKKNATRADVFEKIFGIRPWNGDGHTMSIPIEERKGVSAEWWDRCTKAQKDAHVQKEQDSWWNSKWSDCKKKKEEDDEEFEEDEE